MDAPQAKPAPGSKGRWQKFKDMLRSRHPWREAREMLGLAQLPPLLRRLIVGVIGGTVILLGLAMIFLPGPGLLVIPMGLIILATEFVWARRSVNKIRDLIQSAKGMVTGK